VRLQVKAPTFTAKLTPRTPEKSINRKNSHAVDGAKRHQQKSQSEKF
jgi:hypothetical protein